MATHQRYGCYSAQKEDILVLNIKFKLMMSGGWGKRAASRIDRKQFEQDDLLKSLGSQFNVDFSGYDQWQRRSKVVQPVQRPPATKDDVSFTVGLSKSDELCRHSTYRDKKQAAKLEQLQKQRSERIKITELRLQTRRKTLLEYQRRYKELLDENIKLKYAIDSEEIHSHATVKALLRKYEKYRGGMTTLSTNFVKELEDALRDLKETKTKLSDSISGLEQQVTIVDEELKSQQNQLHVLNSYKDKEYPVKAMKISNLQKDMEGLKISNQDEQEELQHIINTEIGKYHKKRVHVANQITHTVTEKAVSMMHPSLKDMALQNLVMQKEIEFHTREQQDLQEVIQDTEAEVDHMLRDPLTNTRLQMFPEFYSSTQKCTPEMEVILDIPTQEWLPI
ncbi:uncharacterized protein C20orf96-like isoform X2 [Haliotis rubra]|uniref:uncharacterized protein C20orf96-like isoform X2 n=1 Tax=Haliotis rubra TaxID=36100 RepID=UPI001EE5610E|nr:uncharacterized protein C20orf96-like isoform X2 [Haliotis rubra]